MTRNKFLYFWDVLSRNPANTAKCAAYSILALSMGLGLSACGETKTAGGGPSGTEAGNAITAQILTADKSPAAECDMKSRKLTQRCGIDTGHTRTARTDQSPQHYS